MKLLLIVSMVQFIAMFRENHNYFKYFTMVHIIDLIPSALTAALKEAKKIVIFTGAGASADSGIPTFRDALNSHWSKLNPYDLASPEGWEKDKELVWAWYEGRRGDVMKAQPNKEHLGIAQLELDTRYSVSVITQNVDDLHERAGSRSVLHLHGSLFSPMCEKCGKSFKFPESPPVNTPKLMPPNCQVCDHAIRPGVVWFGEALPQDVFETAEKLALKSDLFLCVGTSGVVTPAALLPLAAKNSGAFVVEINPNPSDIKADLHWEVSASEGISRILEFVISLRK